MKRLRIVFIGCVAFSEAALAKVLKSPHAEVVGVITRDTSPINADFRSLAPLAKSAGCPTLIVNGNNQPAMIDFLRSQAPDVVFCIGWSYLLGPDGLTTAPHGVIGFHPAALPQNRGRHPLIWALALGLNQTATTFFRMEEGADSGPIVSQRTLTIAEDDDAATLYVRMTETALPQIDDIIAALATDKLPAVPQDDALSNTWRKRGRADGRIDWRMEASAIRNLVKALARPYVGAHCETPAGDMRVWRVEIGPAAPSNIEPGKVLAVDASTILVKCSGGTVRLVEHAFDPLPTIGAYL